MKTITNLYRKYIPVKIRNTIYQLFLREILNTIRARNRKKIEAMLEIDIPRYYLLKNVSYPEEYLSAANWIKNNGFSVFPFDYTFKYKINDIIVYHCNDSRLNYVLHGNKRLYFPKQFSKTECKKYYQSLLCEQDIESPHRYNYSPFHESQISTLLDIGAAEGIFALSVIDFVDKIYLFECDSLWRNALEWTFKSYGNKVKIVQKYVSDQGDEDIFVTIDSFMFDKKVDGCYIKMDIEGAELSALRGANNLLDGSNLFLSICTYHTDVDAEFISKYLEDRGFKYNFTSGVMAFGNTPPYFRKGVLYANK